MKKCLKYRPETSVSHKWNIGFKTLALDLGIKKRAFLWAMVDIKKFIQKLKGLFRNRRKIIKCNTETEWRTDRPK